VVLSGREFPSPTVRESDLVTNDDHPPPPPPPPPAAPWTGPGTALTYARDSPALAMAAETFALIAWTAPDDEANMFDVRSERMGKDDDDDDDDAVDGEGRTLAPPPPPSTTTSPHPPLVPARLGCWKVVAMEPAMPPIIAFQGLPPKDDDDDGGGGGCVCGSDPGADDPPSPTTATTTTASSSSSSTIGRGNIAIVGVAFVVPGRRFGTEDSIMVASSIVAARRERERVLLFVFQRSSE
jgi:hypothetical protein